MNLMTYGNITYVLSLEMNVMGNFIISNSLHIVGAIWLLKNVLQQPAFNGITIIRSGLKEISFAISIEECLSVFMLVIILCYKGISYSIELFYIYKIEKDCLQYELYSIEDVCIQIDTYPISNCLKKKLKSHYLLPDY